MKEIVTNSQAADTDAYAEWQRLIDEKDIPCHQARSGDWIDLGEGATLQFLWPPADAALTDSDDTNNNSSCSGSRGVDVSFLLTGDLEAASETALLQSTSIRKQRCSRWRTTAPPTPRASRSSSRPPPRVGHLRRRGQPLRPSVDGDPRTPRRHDRSTAPTSRATSTFSTDGERLWIIDRTRSPPCPHALTTGEFRFSYSPVMLYSLCPRETERSTLGDAKTVAAPTRYDPCA